MQQNEQRYVIEAHNVSRVFDGNVGVFDLDLRVPKGTIFGLIGPSGSGKTTAIRLLTGHYKPDQGKLRVLDTKDGRFSRRVRERIGYMPQQFVLYPDLTVRENLSFMGAIYGVGYFKRRKRMRELLEFVQLYDARKRRGSKLSGGMQRRLMLACSLIHDPELLFADEPTAGIDPILRGTFWDYFREVRDSGRTIFVTTQYVGEAAYCDLVGVMRQGEIIYVDTPEALRHKAMGGEIVKLSVDPGERREAASLLANNPIAREVQLPRNRLDMIYVVVEDAGEAFPVIFQLLQDHPTIVIREAEEHQIPFDDVFIRLMEQYEQDHG